MRNIEKKDNAKIVIDTGTLIIIMMVVAGLNCTFDNQWHTVPNGSLFGCVFYKSKYN